MTPQTQRVFGLVALGVAALLLWDQVVLWPLKVLIVLFHELGHALAALATGGEVLSIDLDPSQGGVTSTRGGNRFLVLSAGYLGSLAFGVLWLFMGRTPRRARAGMWFLAALLVGCTLVWMRPVMSFGFSFTLAASAVAVAVAWLARADVSQWSLKALGVFSSLYGLWDIRDDVLARSIATSDASRLAEITFIPAPVWGVLWLVIGVGTLVALRRWVV